MVRSRAQKIRELITTHSVLGILSILFIFPIVYTLMTSFKSQTEVRTNPLQFIPQEWVLDGYRQVLFRKDSRPNDTACNLIISRAAMLFGGLPGDLQPSDMLCYNLPNTMVNSLGSSVLTVTIAGLAGYAFSRYKFRGSRALQLVILGLIMIPGLTNLVPIYKLASARLPLVGGSLLNDYPSLLMIGVYTAGGLPFTIWVIKSFFDAIPLEIEEAALIDGCSALQALRFVVMPLAAPGLLAGFLLMFVDTWNEFLAAALLLNGAHSKTATVGLYAFQSSFETNYPVWTAACIIIMLPVVVLFLALRRTFFQAMLQGALKG